METREESVTPLEEMTFKQAMAAGALGLATAGSPAATTPAAPGTHHTELPASVQQRIGNAPSDVDTLWKQAKEDRAYNPKHNKLAWDIAERYKIPFPQALEIVKCAHEYQRKNFPAADILALIGIESSFNPHAKSGLKTDPALGLMQVRPGAWKLEPEQLKTIREQIRFGVQVFDYFQQKLKSKKNALSAYNVGLRAHREGRGNPNYVQKFEKERSFYAPEPGRRKPTMAGNK